MPQLPGDLDIDLGHRQPVERSKAPRLRQHVERGRAQRGRLSTPVRQSHPRGVAVPPPAPASQPVVVKVETPSAGAQGIRPAYLTRGTGRGGQDAALYGPGAAHPQQLHRQMRQDHHRFSLIVMYPEHGGLDRTKFIEEYMAIVAQDLGTALEWMAADHYNTAHPHTHIVLRAVAQDGEDLYMKKSYFKLGLRERAQALLTRYIGQVRAAEVDKHRQRAREIQRDLNRLSQRLDGMVVSGSDPDLVLQKQRPQVPLYGHEGMAAHLPRLADELTRRDEAQRQQAHMREREHQRGWGR